MARLNPLPSFRVCGVGLIVLAGCAPLGDGGDSTSTFPPRILDFVFIDDSTILISAERDRLEGQRLFERSDDGGETWSFLGEAKVTDENLKETIERLVLGANQSIWGIWRRIGIGAPLDRLGIAISRDRGHSFEIIDLAGTGAFPRELIERPGADPLIIDWFSGQLWHKPPESEDVAEAVVPLGISSPDDLPATGVFCNELLFVAPGDLSDLTVTIWSSDDLAESWMSTTTSFGVLPRLTCGLSTVPWAILGAIVLRYDTASGVWQGVEIVPDLETPPTGRDIGGLAANGESLFVSGLTAMGRTFIRRFEAGQLVESFPTPRSDDIGWYQLKFDNEGRLWAAGPGLFRYLTSERRWESVWP